MEHALGGGVSTMEMKSQSELKWELKWKRASQLARERERESEKERGKRTHTRILAMRERNDKQIQMHSYCCAADVDVAASICSPFRACFSTMLLASSLFSSHWSNPQNVFKTNKTNYNQAKRERARCGKTRGDIFQIFEFSYNLIRNLLKGAAEMHVS